MKRIIPINKEPGYEWDVYGDGTYILVLQNDLKSWLPKPTFDTQFFKVQDNVIIPKSETLKTSIKSNIEIDTELGDENAFFNKKGEFVSIQTLNSHSGLTDKDGEAEFQHITLEQKASLHTHNNKEYLDGYNPTLFATALQGEKADSALQALPSNTVVDADYSALKDKVNGIEENANNYIHPTNHPATIIAQTSSYRFVTDTEKSTWNAKSSLTLGTTSETAYRGDYGNTAYTHSQSAHAPIDAQKNSDITKEEIEEKLTGEITSHTHSTYVPTSRTVAGKALTDNITLAKGDVGLSNVDNTSDANKPVSTAQQTAINSGVTEAKTYADGKSALAIPLTQKGAASGVAELDASGKVLSSQLPSYVDEVLNYTTQSEFPATGESGKIYITEDTNKTYRWTGSAYIEISPSIALGTTSSTAYRGDHGLIAYNHSQAEHQTIVNGTGFVKANGKTLSYDNSSYSLSSHNHSGVYQPLHTGLTNIATQSANATEGLLKKTGANTWTFDTNTYSLGTHNHTGVYEPVFSKNTAFNKNFGTTAGTVSEGNHTHTFASLTSKPNTISGYGITNAYTKTDTDTAIDAIEVGGRNLIRNTKDLTGYAFSTSDTYLGFNIARTTRGDTGFLDTFASTTIDIAAGSTYIASFYARASVTTPMKCFWYSPNTTTSSLTSTGYASTLPDGTAIIEVTTEWKKYWVVWTQTLTELPKNLIIGRNETIEGAILEIAGVKLETGNKPTDWTPAPEDLVTDIISTNATNNTGTIVIDTTPNWQRVNIGGGGSTLVLDYANGILPTKNREYLLVINNANASIITLTLPTVSFTKGGITYNFMNATGSYPISTGRNIEVNVIFFFIDATTCNIRTLITPF